VLHPAIVELPDFRIEEFKNQKSRQFGNPSIPKRHFHLMHLIPVDDVCSQLLYL